MSLQQYFRLFLDYRDIWIPTNEPCRVFGCDLVDKLIELPGRRLVIMNVFVTLFWMSDTDSIDYKQ